MQASEVLNNSCNLIDSSVNIEGFLIVLGDNIYIAPDEDSSKDIHKSILITQQNFLDKLYDVPPWVGGPLYQDHIEIRGKLSKSDLAPFPLALKDITSAHILRDGEVFELGM